MGGSTITQQSAGCGRGGKHRNLVFIILFVVEVLTLSLPAKRLDTREEVARLAMTLANPP